MQIIDNFYDQETFDKFQRLILGPSLPWYYCDKLSAPDWLKVIDPLAIETDGMMFTIVDRKLDYYTEEYDVLRPFFQKLAEKLGKKEEDLYRIRAGMKWPHIGITDEFHNYPHIDSPMPNQTALLYMNDSDGDTRLFHQIQSEIKNPFLKDNPTDKEREEYANQFILSGFTIEHRVTPKANRLLLFNGMQYHTSGMPVSTNRRVIININME
jgi:hypothetical protein